MITDRLMGNQANDHPEAILPRKSQSSCSSAVEFLVQHERLCSLESVASEYSTLVARKGMSIFPNGPSRATLQSLQSAMIIRQLLLFVVYLTLTDPLRIQPWSLDRRNQTKSNRKSEISRESRQKRTDKKVASKGHRRDKTEHTNKKHTGNKNKLEATA